MGPYINLPLYVVGNTAKIKNILDSIVVSKTNLNLKLTYENKNHFPNQFKEPDFLEPEKSLAKTNIT